MSSEILEIQEKIESKLGYLFKENDIPMIRIKVVQKNKKTYTIEPVFYNDCDDTVRVFVRLIDDKLIKSRTEDYLKNANLESEEN